MSFICSIILGYMDKRADRILRKSEAETGEVVSKLILIILVTEGASIKEIKKKNFDRKISSSTLS